METNYKELLLDLQKYENQFEDLFSNIFTLREIGNKTHGDMAEIALTEFVNSFLSNKYKAIHVGKELFRKKNKEEDILVINNLNKKEIPISVKAYGIGPLQLSTDKNYTLFPLLESYNTNMITNKEIISEIVNNENFNHISNINVLPLIYDEDNHKCNIMIYDFDTVKNCVSKIEKELPNGRRVHPVYKFFNDKEEYLFEVRYGGTNANALQRGVWTHTKKAETQFISITNGWINYTTRIELLNILSKLMITSENQLKTLTGLMF